MSTGLRTHRLAKEAARFVDLDWISTRRSPRRDQFLVLITRGRRIGEAYRGSSQTEEHSSRRSHALSSTQIRVTRVLIAVDLKPQITGCFVRSDDRRRGQIRGPSAGFEID